MVERRLLPDMRQQSPTTCAICDRGVAARFVYRTLNGARRREEPLCEHCAAILADTPSVAEIAPSRPAVARVQWAAESD